MRQYRLCKLFVAVGLSAATSAALASPQAFMSSRSFAMGGTGVAIAHPASATSANPAMMAADQHAWADDFGLTLPSINARVADEEETIDQVDDIQDVIEGLESKISGFNPSTDNPQAIQTDAANLRDRLNAFDDDTMRANIGLGFNFAVPGKTLAVGAFTNANLTATVRGSVSDKDKNALNLIANANTATDVQNEIDKIKNLDGSLDFTSEGKILASAVIEAGISFARALELSNGDTIQLGLSPKYVELRTFQYTETVSGFDDNEFDSDDSQTDKSGFNLDIGAAYAFGDEKQWNAGILVKKPDSHETGFSTKQARRT